jgi:hypothetical protein
MSLRHLVVTTLLIACQAPIEPAATPPVEPPAPTPPPAPVVQTPFERDLAPKLAGCLGCHSADSQNGLDLTDLWASVGEPSSQIEMALIASGDHLQSYLWHKVAGTHSIAGGLGQRMPVGSTWSQDDIDLLARWINLGVPR